MKYTNYGKILCDENAEEVYNSLINITSIKNNSPKNDFRVPFLFLEGSSGTGKTQFAFTIMNLLNTKRIYFYFLFETSSSEISQEIYTSFHSISKLFVKCYTNDRLNINDRTNSPTCASLYYMELYIFGFIFELLQKGVLYTDQVQIQKRSGEDITTLLKEKQLENKRPVFIIDECVALNETSNWTVKFIINCFRCLGFGLVILGTNSRAAELHSLQGNHSRGGSSSPWCQIYGCYPKINLTLLGINSSIPDWTTDILINSRPWFSEETVNKIRLMCGFDFDSILESVFHSLISQKKIFHKFFGRFGQVCIFHNMYFKVNDTGNYGKTPLVHYHFFQLDIWNQNVVLYSDNTIEGKEWEPQSILPRMDEDILLYLVFMGGKNFSPFMLGRKEVPYACFLYNVMKDNEYREIDFGNSVQKSNNGMFMEALLCTSVCVASHSNGVKGISVTEFLKNLIYQLQNVDNIEPSAVQISDIDKLKLTNFDGKEFMVPYLSPPNQSWPEWLKIPDAFFDNLKRTQNKDNIDFSTDCNITGEAKDHGKLTSSVAQDILIRIPTNSILHIVFIRELQEKGLFFQSKNKFEDIAKGKSHLNEFVYYSLDSSNPKTGLYPIMGLPNTGLPKHRAVIFVLISAKISK